jgi:NitT/TauT family transport system ATP-binding protein
MKNIIYDGQNGDESQMFRLDHITKSFQINPAESIDVLKNINFDLYSHDFISIIGPSGCGKTTLLRIFAGFEKYFTGNVLFSPDQGQKFENISLLGKVGYMPQEFSLFPWLTVEDNIRFGLKIKKIAKPEQDQIMENLLKLVNLTKFRRYYPKEISGGMQQRVALCRALAINPTSNLILMDEPFSALDAQTRNKLQEELLQIWQSHHLTILFVTHNIDEAVFLSNKVYVLSQTPAEIIYSQEIHIPHPRERTSVEFNQIRKDLLQYLRQSEEIKK